MGKKCVLVIDDDVKETEIIASILQDNRISISHVTTGRAALTLLMGKDKEEESERINPDVIVIRSVLPDMSAYEMCNVLRNYYRFSKVRFYMIAGKEEIKFTAGYDGLLFAGIIERPITVNSQGYARLEQLKMEMGSNKLASLLPLVSLGKWKMKSAGVKATFVTGMKWAACCAGIFISGYAFKYVTSDRDEILRAIQTPTAFVQEAASEPAVVSIPDLPESEREATSSDTIVENKPVKSESSLPVIESAPEQVSVEIVDTVRPPRVYKIGIKAPVEPE